jgi:hypothetical protein
MNEWMNEDFDHNSFLLVSILPNVKTCGFQELEHSPLVITSVHHFLVPTSQNWKEQTNPNFV